MKVLVIGGTLFIGRSLVASLLKAGHEVTILHRKPGHDLGKRVREIMADRNDLRSLQSALTGHKFDVVSTMSTTGSAAPPPRRWKRRRGPAATGLQRYIFMSSVAAYGDGLNHHEGDALAPDNHPDAYVRNKAMSERALFRMHQRNGFPVVTLRPPFVYGPENPYYREAFFWDRLRDNRPIILPGDGRRLMQFVYVKDLIWAALQGRGRSACQSATRSIWRISKPITQFDLVHLLAEVAGKPVSLCASRGRRSCSWAAIRWDRICTSGCTSTCLRLLR